MAPRKPFVDRTTPVGEHLRKNEWHKSYANELRMAEGRNWISEDGASLHVEAYDRSANFPYPSDNKGQINAFLQAADWLYACRRSRDDERTSGKAIDSALEGFHDFMGQTRDTPEGDVRRFVEALHEYCVEKGIDLAEIVADPYAHHGI